MTVKIPWPDKPLFLTVAQVAEILEMTKPMVAHLIYNDEIPMKFHEGWKIKVSQFDLKRYIDGKEKENNE